MSNTLLTLNQITREAVRLFRNSNAFIGSIDRQYDDQFARDGAKIGNTLRIRLPNDFVVTTGTVAASPQNTVEPNTTLTLTNQDHVDVQYSSQDLTLSLQDYSERILAPMVNNLAGSVAANVMTGAESICNYISKTTSGSIVTPTANEWLLAGAALDLSSAPRGNRKAILDPYTQARTVSSLAGLFNPTGTVAKQFTTGEMMGPALGIQEWMSDQTVLKHTTGAYGTDGTVNGASQTGTTITVTALNGPLKKGDIITFAGVNQVNRITKLSVGTPAQFVLTADAAASATSLSIYPALIPGASGTVQYATVDVSPANGAAFTVVSKASEVYRKNFVMRPEAVTLATADLIMPKGVHDAARENYDGISMRMVSQYNVSSDQFITRLDVLYGWSWVRPEWACVVADAV